MAQAFSIEKTVREARTEEKAIAIAAELRKGGEYVAYGQEEGVFGVYKKSFSNAPDTSYLVNLNGKATCTCPDFDKHQDYCKHIRGLEIALDMDAHDAAQLAKLEAEYLNIEDACEYAY